MFKHLLLCAALVASASGFGKRRFVRHARCRPPLPPPRSVFSRSLPHSGYFPGETECDLSMFTTEQYITAGYSNFGGNTICSTNIEGTSMEMTATDIDDCKDMCTWAIAVAFNDHTYECICYSACDCMEAMCDDHGWHMYFPSDTTVGAYC